MGAPRLQRKTRPAELPIRPGARLRLWTRVQRRVAVALLPQQPRGWRSAPPRRSRASRGLAFGSLGLCVLAVLLMITGLVAGGAPSELRAGPLAGGLQAPAAETARSRPAERTRDRPARRHKRKHRRRSRAAAPAQPVRAGSAGAAPLPAARQAPRDVRTRRGPGGTKKPPRDRSPQPAPEAPPQGTPSAPSQPTTPTAQPTAPQAPPASTTPTAPGDGEGDDGGRGNGPDGSGPPGQAGR